MDNELLTSESSETISDNSAYLDAIKNLKANTVDKASYEALKADNKRLLDAVINGTPTSDEPKQDENVPTRMECYEKYIKNNFSSDLDYWKNIVALRDATIREYGKDPCVTGNFGVTPTGDKVAAEYGEAESVENEFNTIKDIIEESNNDPATFELLMRQAIKK